MFEDSLTRECKQILRKNNLNPIKRLGKGGFGVVYLVSKTDFCTYQTQLFSVKCTNKKNFVKKSILRRYLKQQITILQSLNHQNIVKLIRTFQDSGWIFMVMEYCNLGNLATIQHQKNSKIFCLEEAIKIIISVINGLLYMHEKKIIHRDIKPENILLTKCEKDQNILVKICDLGFARQAEDTVETFCGTTYYMAPEIHSKKKYDHKIDVWAIGVLFFAMIYGTHPFKGINMLAQIEQKCLKGFNLDKIKKSDNQSITLGHQQILKTIFLNIFQINPIYRYDLIDLKKTLNSFQQNHPQLLISPKNSQKQTQDSYQTSQQDTQFYIQEIEFVQSIKQKVLSLQFLSNMEELVLKYYLDKICLSIMHLNGHNPENSKNICTNYVKQLKKNQQIDGINIASNLKKIPIKKFPELFSLNSLINFQSYKEAYRLVVGHVFYRAHKSIDNYQLKNQIKLKLFCCHVINRVFEKNHIHELFKHYYEWLCENKMQPTFTLSIFKQWIQQEIPEKIIQTVQIINHKFYKKNR